MNIVSLSMPRAVYRPTAAVLDSIAAMLIFVGAEIMFFSGLISAFIVVKAGALWPPPGQPRLPIKATALNTLVLLASGFVLLQTNCAFAKFRDADRTKRLLTLSIGLGLFFLTFQGYEWVRLLRFGLTMTASTYGAFFYLIVGVLAWHAVVALFALSYCNVQLARGELTPAAFSATQIFWYFVVILWPILYLLVYLT
jgi:cytochrome c oxidase subunit III